ncbi:hypothetical protein F5Y17DRAFT_429082 [Xylariaceae sp. FL0594]|nr:hypothetical protein F5Y17DRAFT_429082 [Xylariaceae sp. FL0594]
MSYQTLWGEPTGKHRLSASHPDEMIYPIKDTSYKYAPSYEFSGYGTGQPAYGHLANGGPPYGPYKHGKPIHNEYANRRPTNVPSGPAASRDVSRIYPPSLSRALAAQEAGKYGLSADPFYRALRFPALMRTVEHRTHGGLNFNFHLCAPPDDRMLYAITFNQQLFGPRITGPVGPRQAMLLRQSPAEDSRVLAAATDEQLMGSPYGIPGSLNTDLILFERDGKQHTVAVMQPGITIGDTVCFMFTFQHRNLRGCPTEGFAWVKVPKGSPTPFERGGFRLVHIPQDCLDREITAERLEDNSQTLVLLVPHNGWFREIHNSDAHAWTLHFGRGCLEHGYDHHWSRLVVVTAARIHIMDIMGRTKVKTLQTMAAL